MSLKDSVLQLLRHVPEFLEELEIFRETSALMSTLHSIFSNCGSLQSISALFLRDILAQVTNTKINSGGQKDTVELLSFLLNHCPSELFDFETSVEYRFWINNCCAPCPN